MRWYGILAIRAVVLGQAGAKLNKRYNKAIVGGRRPSRVRLQSLQSIELDMSDDIAEIEARIRSLSIEDKTKLIRGLIADLDRPADADVEPAWLEEAQRRQREMTEGKVEPVPGERVFENLRSR